MHATIIRTLNQTARRKKIDFGLPDKKYIFLMLIKFITMNKTGITTKNKAEEYFSFLENS
jgi:hypothetical protein